MFAWIHTCPQRASDIAPTLASVCASDLPDVEVWGHSEDLRTSDQIEAWWEERLLLASERSEFFIRLEDDVVVSRSIHQRVSTWGALQQPDFGVGLLYRWKGSPSDSWNVERSEAFPRVQDPYHMSAQGMVFKSALVPALVEKMREIRTQRGFRRIGFLNFDTVLGQACHKLGLAVYLHEPSVVDCREVKSINQPGATLLCSAKDFVED